MVKSIKESGQVNEMQFPFDEIYQQGGMPRRNITLIQWNLPSRWMCWRNTILNLKVLFFESTNELLSQRNIVLPIKRWCLHRSQKENESRDKLWETSWIKVVYTQSQYKESVLRKAILLVLFKTTYTKKHKTHYKELHTFNPQEKASRACVFSHTCLIYSTITTIPQRYWSPSAGCAPKYLGGPMGSSSKHQLRDIRV